ncbi:hypothetical protein L6E12_31400 [Actinokineospora sp. PR83]|nr:hypothetical protein [Actinokineospora sp. PR83]MCG8920285.1 hypothetical protein [Actinokineospora sp. PR83]
MAIETLSRRRSSNLYRQLDSDYQVQVNDNLRELADNVVGDEHWDSGN